MPDGFSERFAQAWQNPTPEGLGSLLAEDIVLIQPHIPPIIGRKAAIAEFKKLFDWLPGTWSETVSSFEFQNAACIEHVLHLPAGRAVIKIRAIDRFELKDGLATKRIVYFDQVPLIIGVLKHPSVWLGFIRYRFGRG